VAAPVLATVLAGAVLAGAVLAASAGLAPASAEQLVVAEGGGVSLLVGQTIDGDQPLALQSGQWVTLIAANGRILKLQGPWQGPPAPGGAPALDNGVIKSLRELTEPQRARSDTLGVTRALATATLPEPWLVDVGTNGDRCVLRDGVVTLWRARLAPAIGVDVRDGTGAAVLGPVAWPDKADRLPLPAEFKPRDGEALRLKVGDTPPVTLTFHVLPRTVREPATQAAWLALSGCADQARLILDGLEH